LTQRGTGGLLLLVGMLCLMVGMPPHRAAAQESCGTWRGESPDARIQLTQVGDSVGRECRGVFVLSSETGGSALRGHTLELRTAQLGNGRLEWPSLQGSTAGDGVQLLIPSQELELHALPVDRSSGAQISLEGKVSLASLAVDTAGSLLRTALTVTTGHSCEVPDDNLERTAAAVSSMVEPALRLLWDGDLVGAKGALGGLLPGLFEQSSSMLEAMGAACAAESLTAAGEQTAVLQKLETEFLAWLPVAVYDYFDYQAQPALVLLEYTAPAGATPRWPTSTPDSVSSSEGEVLAVLQRYEEIRIRSHGPSHDITGLEDVLAEDSLKTHRERVEWQREHNAYYLIKVHESHVEEMRIINSTQIDALVDKRESREYYVDGTLDTRETVYNDHYQVWYQFKQINGSWYIVDRSVMTPTPEANTPPSGSETSTPIPTRRPPTATPPPLASNVRDFSGIQGAKGWKYLMEDSRNSGRWKEMKWGDYKGRSCWLTSNWETDVRICGGGELAPGMSTRVAYEWRTDAARKVAVRVRAQKIDTACGDGIQVTVQRVVDGQGSRTLESFRVSARDSQEVSKSYSVDVGPGVLIFVFVDIVGNSQCDASRIAIDVY
jgi:hypothetical protein